MEFADRLKNIIEQSGISQSKLAERSGLSSPTISMIISRKRQARIDTLCMLCDALQMTPNDLLGYGQPKEQQPVKNGKKVRPIDGNALRSRIRKYLAAGVGCREDMLTSEQVYDMIDTMPVIEPDECK